MLDHHDRVVTQCDPPEQNVNLCPAQARAHLVDQRLRARRQLAVGQERGADIACRIGFFPIFGLIEQLADLRGHERGMAHDRHIPGHFAPGIQEPGQEPRRRRPGHDNVGAGIARLGHLVGEVRLVVVDQHRVDRLDAQFFEHLGRRLGAGGAIARGVGDDRDFLLLEHVDRVAVRRRDPLRVCVYQPERARVLLGVDELIDGTDHQRGHARARQDRRGGQPLARVDRPDDKADLVAEGQLLGEVDGLGRVARRIAGQQFDLPAKDAAARIDLLDRELDALVLGECRRG